MTRCNYDALRELCRAIMRRFLKWNPVLRRLALREMPDWRMLVTSSRAESAILSQNPSQSFTQNGTLEVLAILYGRLYSF
jgi:hypothetical protein